jgi:hypothetical protein
LSLNSARIDAGDEIKITTGGTPLNYTYTHSSQGSKTVSGSFIMIGGTGTGFFDANNIALTGLAVPITVNAPGGLTKDLDVGRGDAVVQTGLSTFNESLLAYSIFAANEETRSGRFRKGLGEGDDLGAPACK